VSSLSCADPIEAGVRERLSYERADWNGLTEIKRNMSLGN